MHSLFRQVILKYPTFSGIYRLYFILPVIEVNIKNVFFFKNCILLYYILHNQAPSLRFFCHQIEDIMKIHILRISRNSDLREALAVKNIKYFIVNTKVWNPDVPKN